MTINRTTVNKHGFTAMLERLGRDCAPAQYLREYVQNSIEAILRTPMKGRIEVDVNWYLSDGGGGYKLSFTDNGEGMEPVEMVTLMKDLASSKGGNQFENYGMGAKIASMTRNRAGILYESWKNGEGSRILMKYDEVEDAYGLERFNVNGEYLDYIPANPDGKPAMIEGHGTRVTLLGMVDEQDTLLTPDGVTGSREAWMYQVLNSRYYLIPDGIELFVRIGYYRAKDNTRHNYLAEVRVFTCIQN